MTRIWLCRYCRVRLDLCNAQCPARARRAREAITRKADRAMIRARRNTHPTTEADMSEKQREQDQPKQPEPQPQPSGPSFPGQSPQSPDADEKSR